MSDEPDADAVERVDPELADPDLSSWRWLGLLLGSPVVLLLWLTPWVLAFGLLGVAHTVGHAVAARALGIDQRLQLGFGPRLVHLRLGKRALDVAPLPGAAIRLGLDGAPARSTALALLSGPLAALGFGLALAVLLLTLTDWGAIAAAPVVGSLDADGAGARAGIEVGDRIVRIDGVAIERWSQVAEQLQDGGEVVLERGVTLRLEEDPGLHAYRRAPIVAVDPDGSWAAAGARTGDRVIEIDGTEVITYDELEGRLETARSAVVERSDGTHPLDLEPGPAGIVYADRVIGGVLAEGAADRAGLRAGDRLLSLNGSPLTDWNSLRDQLSERDVHQVVFVREGAVHQVEVEPELRRIDGEERRLLGIERLGGLYLEPITGPPLALPDALVGAVAQIGEATRATLAQLGSLVAGRMEPRTLGGPVYVVQPPSGWSLLRVAALLVLNATLVLTLYNLLPLPGSDVLAALDQVARRRFGRALPLRLYTWICAGGLVVVGLLVFAMDVSRVLGA